MSPLDSFWTDLERSRARGTPGPSGVSLTLTPHAAPAPHRTRAQRRRSRRPIEPTDFAAMMRRMLRAHGRRVADADMEDLAELMALQRDLDDAIAYAVREGRARWGWSWADIGRAAGIKRQSAHERWGQR